MNRNTTAAILRFAVLIMLLATVLFFVVDTSSPQFIAICITMFFCTLMYIFAIIRLKKDADNPLETKRAIVALIIYLSVLATLVGIRIITAFL